MDANRAALSMTGRTREALVGTPFVDFFDDPERARAGVGATFRKGEIHDYVLNLRRSSGRSLPVSFNATLFSDAAGAVQGVVAIARPSTEASRRFP